MKKKARNEKIPETVYFRDEINDEFSSVKISPKLIDENYKYVRDGSFFGKAISFIVYRVLAMPIAFLYLKLKFRHKTIGKEKLAGIGAAFIYGNHTQQVADALIPTFISMPKKAYVIVHPANVSMPLLGRLTPYMGALPLPDGLKAARNFNAAVKRSTELQKPVFIYPEAHIWPYYTGIRNFPSDSFSYPIKYGTPVFCFTNTYQKRKRGKGVRLVTYIDGPFYPKNELCGAAQRADLRTQVYNSMKSRAEMSTAVMIKYEPLCRSENKAALSQSSEGM